MREVTKIKSGNYSIGSNSIPNASPMHSRQMRSFWIDCSPVTFGHLERFVAGGGYDDESFWSDSGSFDPPTSIQKRCDELRQHSTRSAALFREPPRRSRDIPLVGVSWMEAAAIARFAGGRLPFESEWEVAMSRDGAGAALGKHKETTISECWQSTSRSRWGCVLAMNVLQEWTADGFSPRYWRADSNRHGNFWTAAQTYGVSLRGGCASDMYNDHRFRRAADPTEVHSARGFRRVWEKEPSLETSSSFFVLPCKEKTAT